MSRLEVVPVTFRQAKSFVAEFHRHHKPPQGHKFSIGVTLGGELVGVCMVGRPVSRHLDDGRTAEVIRLCTDGTRNACSILYAAAWRAAQAMGYRKIVTYILGSEPGVSLKAAGWSCEGAAGGGSWSSKKRPREDKAPTEVKTRWAKT